MNLSSLLASVKASLENAAVPSPRVDAEIIVSHALGIPRARIYVDADRPVTASEESSVLELARERAKRVPLQYVTGECGFMSLTFKVARGVFIPRPETETLVESLIRQVGAMPKSPRRMLDIGTGCGVIAISLAKYLDPALVVGTDISYLAVDIAKENAILNGVQDVTRFVVSDGLRPIRRESGTGDAGLFDVIACNPPYVASAEIDGLEPEVRGHEPRMALDGGANGFRFIEGILPLAASILADGGLIGFEIGQTQSGFVTNLFRQAGLQDVEVSKDLSGRDRVVTGRV